MTITAYVGNDGKMTGSISYPLVINGQMEQNKGVTVNGEATSSIVYTVAKSQPGTYKVEVGGRQATFQVIGPASSAPISTPLIIGIALIFAALFLGIIGYVVRSGQARF